MSNVIIENSTDAMFVRKSNAVLDLLNGDCASVIKLGQTAFEKMQSNISYTRHPDYHDFVLQVQSNLEKWRQRENEIQQEIEALNRKMTERENKISELRHTRSTLDSAKLKQKKEIDEQISVCEAQHAADNKLLIEKKARIDPNTNPMLALESRANSIRQFPHILDRLYNHNTIGAGFSHTVALKADGSVVAVGSNECGECNVSDWTEIVAISAAGFHTVGLKANGTVIAVGSNEHGECNVSDWTDIVAVAASTCFTVGLKDNGTVVTAGQFIFGSCEVCSWTDIIAISAGDDYIVGLKADGSVVLAGMDYGFAAAEVSSWTDVIAVSAGGFNTFGLKADGTVLAVGSNSYGACNISQHTAIVAVDTSLNRILLNTEGKLFAAGNNAEGQLNVDSWTDIVAVAAGKCHTIGLTAKGTMVAVGYNSNGQCNVSSWHGIRLPY